MFKHILIPTDGSELSERVVNRGVMLAKTLGATVIGLHVIPSNFGAYLGLYGDTPWLDIELQDQMREAATAGGNKYLDRMEARPKPPVSPLPGAWWKRIRYGAASSRPRKNRSAI